MEKENENLENDVGNRIVEGEEREISERNGREGERDIIHGGGANDIVSWRRRMAI